jgi:AcrR family transcriptional regulator
MAEPRRQPVSGRRRRRTRAGTELSRDVYIDAAVNLIEKRGAAIVSARSLATAVGADPSALYRYFSGVDDVLRAVADRMIGMALDQWSPGVDWLDSLARLARQLHRVYVREFPRTGLTVAARTTGLPNEIRAVDLTIGLLRAGGFDDASAARWFRSLSDFLLGQAMLESAFSALPDNLREADDAAWQALSTRLPDAVMPNAEIAAPHLQTLMLESSFEATLELIQRGLAASPRTAPADG